MKNRSQAIRILRSSKAITESTNLNTQDNTEYVQEPKRDSLPRR
ncbi:hypothetical protein ACRE1S_02930 [Helicobacter himalayensis]